MARSHCRVRIDQLGRIEIVDPGFDALPLLRAIRPDFQVQTEPLAGFTQPRLETTRALVTGVKRSELPRASESHLWASHREALKRCYRSSWAPAPAVEPEPDQATLLELKIELGQRLLTRCRLCPRRCGVNRARGELGFCAQGSAGRVAEHFTHIAEEAAINPSYIISLQGCSLRCRFCQQSQLVWEPRSASQPLDRLEWLESEIQGARSLSFTGGNPDQSVVAILRFLDAAPIPRILPIVWNCNGYASRETIHLLDGIVDVYLPDLKFGNEHCAQRLATAPSYPAIAVAALHQMLEQRVPVIARILVLPGHLDCCHLPLLEQMQPAAGHDLRISVRGQYCPDGDLDRLDPELMRRPRPEEVERVRQRARELGFAIVR